MTYAELIEDVEAWAAELRQHGVKRGDHIGIRMTSGQRDLYLAILATLAAGAWGVHVPSEFVWTLDLADEPASDARFRRLSSISQVLPLIGEIG